MKLFNSRKTYYLYNPNTLNYERVYPSAKDRFFMVMRHLSIGIVIGFGIFFLLSHTLDSPMESLLRKENKLMQTQYEVLSLRLTGALKVLDDIQQRDENLYRAIFQAESIPESVRKSGFGGSNRYEHLMTLSNPELVVSTSQKMDILRKQLYIQSNSLEELIALGKNQEERSKCIPAIQPIANKDLRQTASGYGMRIDPIYRTPRFHSGMDFSAKVGTEIYATGDGVVTFAAWKQGYGNCLIINHGHGYETLYG
ncbi:MAG: M23 family metallopeptidase, partial [Tannerellaceae bacterium]